MAQGTITVTNGSVDVVGTGTEFSKMKPGSFLTFVLTGVAYTVAIDSVQNDMALKLAVKFDGPTTSGVAFDESPVGSMALATMGVTVQAQKALRMMIVDATNWREVFSDKQTITVTLPDGTQFSGYSWGYISQLLKEINIPNLEAIRDQAVAAANSATQSASSAAASESSAEDSANSASLSASNAAASESSAESSSAAASASASASATSELNAKASEDNARQWAQSVNPDNLLKVENNLSDLGDRSQAWLNVRPEGNTPLGGDPINPEDATTQQWVLNKIGTSEPKSYIDGLDVRVMSSGVTVYPGSAVIGNTGEIVEVKSAITVTLPALEAGTFFYIYLYKNGDSAAVEVSKTAPVKYSGKAAGKGPDTSRRFLGYYRVNSSSVVVECNSIGDLMRFSGPNDGDGTLRILANGQSTAYAQINMTGFIVPNIARSIVFELLNTVAAGGSSVAYSGASGKTYSTVQAGGVQYESEVIFNDPASPQLWYKYYSAPSGGGFFVNIKGFRYDR